MRASSYVEDNWFVVFVPENEALITCYDPATDCATRKSPRIMKSTTDSPVKEIPEIQLSPQHITTTHHVSTWEVSNDPGLIPEFFL